MKIHYFQRYYEKENVATANTMLLLSRLYAYSPDKFFRLLKSELLAPDCILDSFEPELTFELQAKSEARECLNNKPFIQFFPSQLDFQSNRVVMFHVFGLKLLSGASKTAPKAALEALE